MMERKGNEMSDEPKRAFTCITCFQHEIGHTQTELWPSPELVREHNPCADECGIVEVEVRQVRVVSPPQIAQRDMAEGGR